MCWLLCLRCVPSMPTLCVRLAAVVSGAMAIFVASATLATIIPHTSWASNMDEDTKTQMAAFGYAVADALAVSREEYRKDGQVCSLNNTREDCQLGPRLQRYLLYLATEVYRQTDRSTLESNIQGNWKAICIGFVSFMMSVGCFGGCLVMYGALTKRLSLLCPWQFQAMILFMAMVSSSVLAVYRAFEIDVNFKGFLSEDNQPTLSRFSKFTLASSVILALQLILLYKMSAKMSTKKATKVAAVVTNRIGYV